MSHVLMVEVDRMNVDAGIIFFCTHFDGEESIPPCSLPYLFFSLYQNHLSDTEQMDIISDALHHTGQTSLIHLQGIKDINEIVQLRLKKNLSSYATYFSACRLLHNQQRAYSPKAKAARILCF